MSEIICRKSRVEKMFVFHNGGEGGGGGGGPPIMENSITRFFFIETFPYEFLVESIEELRGNCECGSAQPSLLFLNVYIKKKS